MKKQELIDIWKKDYKLDSKTINTVLRFVFNLDSKDLFLQEDFDNIYNWQIYFIFEKLSKWFPLEYIIQKADFYWREYYINENCLIPRIDTEILVKNIIDYLKKSKNDYFLLDIWTWSWVIVISILHEFISKIKWAYAIDISKKALEVAIRNAYENSLEEKINFLELDFRKFDFSLFYEKNLIIVANLPYIKNNDFVNMWWEVYNYEPSISLYWWEKTWFELYEELINILIEKKDIFKKLILFIEIWFDQFDTSKKFFEEKWLKFEFFKDTNNIGRVIKIVL